LSRGFSSFRRISYNTVIDSVPDGRLTSEALSNLKRLVGDENILAECSGVNYNIYVTQSRLLVGKRFATGESIVNVPHTNISTLELITKSIIPPLTLAILAGASVALVWWFPGQQRMALPLYPYDYVVIAIGAIFVGALLGMWWRRRVAVLRIGISGDYDPITVKLVSSSKAASVFRALKD
jgi:hypothetical protein